MGEENPDIVVRLVRALAFASKFASNSDNRAIVAHIVAQRLGVNPELVVRTLTGNLKTTTDGAVRKSDRYIVVSGHDANRPDANQAVGPTRRWRDGDRPNCRRSCKRRRKVFFAPTFTIPLSVLQANPLVTVGVGTSVHSSTRVRSRQHRRLSCILAKQPRTVATPFDRSLILRSQIFRTLRLM